MAILDRQPSSEFDELVVSPTEPNFLFLGVQGDINPLCPNEFVWAFRIPPASRIPWFFV